MSASPSPTSGVTWGRPGTSRRRSPASTATCSSGAGCSPSARSARPWASATGRPRWRSPSWRSGVSWSASRMPRGDPARSPGGRLARRGRSLALVPARGRGAPGSRGGPAAAPAGDLPRARRAGRGRLAERPRGTAAARLAGGDPGLRDALRPRPAGPVAGRDRTRSPAASRSSRASPTRRSTGSCGCSGRCRRTSWPRRWRPWRAPRRTRRAASCTPPTASPAWRAERGA